MPSMFLPATFEQFTEIIVFLIQIKNYCKGRPCIFPTYYSPVAPRHLSSCSACKIAGGRGVWVRYDAELRERTVLARPRRLMQLKEVPRQYRPAAVLSAEESRCSRLDVILKPVSQSGITQECERQTLLD